MMPSRPVSDDLRRMAREDSAKAKEDETVRELESILSDEFAGFEARLQQKLADYGEEAAFDAFMEEDLDFKSDLSETIERWIEVLPSDRPFQRGCIYTLKQVKSLLEKIEALNPEEP